MPLELETPRLRLRQWRESDREPFAALNADHRVMEFFPAALDRCTSDAMADRCEALIGQRGWGLWAVQIQGEGPFIGFVGLHVPAADLPFNPCVEVGWRLARSHWGQGLASEAAQAALGFGFETLQLGEIVSFTSGLNLRSQAVMQRLGMVRDEATFQHPSVPEGNALREHCLYRITRERFAGHSRSTRRCAPLAC